MKINEFKTFLKGNGVILVDADEIGNIIIPSNARVDIGWFLGRFKDLKLNLYASLEYMLNNNMYNEYSKLLCARSTELKKRELTKLLKVIKK